VSSYYVGSSNGMYLVGASIGPHLMV